MGAGRRRALDRRAGRARRGADRPRDAARHPARRRRRRRAGVGPALRARRRHRARPRPDRALRPAARHRPASRPATCRRSSSRAPTCRGCSRPPRRAPRRRGCGRGSCSSRSAARTACGSSPTRAARCRCSSSPRRPRGGRAARPLAVVGVGARADRGPRRRRPARRRARLGPGPGVLAAGLPAPPRARHRVPGLPRAGVPGRRQGRARRAGDGDRRGQPRAGVGPDPGGAAAPAGVPRVGVRDRSRGQLRDAGPAPASQPARPRVGAAAEARPERARQRPAGRPASIGMQSALRAPGPDAPPPWPDATRAPFQAALERTLTGAPPDVLAPPVYGQLQAGASALPSPAASRRGCASSTSTRGCASPPRPARASCRSARSS